MAYQQNDLVNLGKFHNYVFDVVIPSINSIHFMIFKEAVPLIYFFLSFHNFPPLSILFLFQSFSRCKGAGEEAAAGTKGGSDDVISLDKQGNVTIKILAKPGAKQNGVTGVCVL